ncbi:hypothetical protein ANN_17393, partial [Periplaneta americana]
GRRGTVETSGGEVQRADLHSADVAAHMWRRSSEGQEVAARECPAMQDSHAQECEYFHMVIRPMLNAGHEGELCEWLKEMGLLRRGLKCSNTNCKGGKMEWNKARVVDKYNWSCTACSKKVPIREGSFFMPLKCDLKVIIQAILSWCERTPVEVAANNLKISACNLRGGFDLSSLTVLLHCPNVTNKMTFHQHPPPIDNVLQLVIRFEIVDSNPAKRTIGIRNLKTHIVKKVYDQCGDVASRYVLDHYHDWLLGGDGAVVVIDVYPDGYMTSTPPDKDGIKKKTQKKILCIADTSCMPARIWARIIQDQSGSPKPGVVEDALKYVQRQVRPGSTLVANDRAICCSYDAVKDLPGYQSVISVETLMELDLPGTRRIQENLETIWQSAVVVCEEVQDLQKPKGNILLHEYMWRQLFATTTSSALEYMLHHIADKYQTKED